MKLIKPILFVSLLLGTSFCSGVNAQGVSGNTSGNTSENPPQTTATPNPNEKCFKLFGEPVCSSEVVNGVYQINDMELFANCEEFGVRSGNTCAKTENGVKFNINNRF